MSLSKPKRVTYKTLTFAEKVAAIQEVEKGLKKKSEIAKDFGIPPNTLSTYLKNKEKILNSVTKPSDKDRKRARGPENPDVDECVLKWFKQARDNNIPLSGTLVRAKAEEFATSLGKDEFKASTGWLDGFKDRNNISFKTVCGESASVDMPAVNTWKTDLLQLIEDRPAKDIFNVDETGLFYRCTPDKTLAFKGQRCSGGKHSKERITLLVGANMDGSEKLPLVMIGKSANPRCFKNVKTKPVAYESNKKAWMTSKIFEGWLLQLDRKFRKQKRTIILFVDNCTAHNTIPFMENVKVVFFPPNMTSVVQPMDQGVIKNFKHFYRRLVVQNILSGMYTDKNGKINIDLLQAARMCNSAWNQVSETTIANCFRKAGFYHKEDDEQVEAAEETVPNVVDNWEDVGHDVGVPYLDFVNMDENLAVCGELTDAEILEDVCKRHESASSEDEGEQPELPQTQIPSCADTMEHISQLRRFVEGQQNVSDSIFQALNRLEDFTTTQCSNSRKQSKISSFFKKL